MKKQHKAAIEATREQLANQLGDEETTPTLLMRGAVAFMVVQNMAHKETATPRSLKPYYGIPVLLESGQTARRNLYKQYEILAAKCEHFTDTPDPKATLRAAADEGLVRWTSKGFVGLPDSFSDGTTRTKAEQPTDAL